ncbi:iron complex outermembrane recepter protein [Alkalispirochaeta americana]|uniref:Iron complex outermembrane recepter protein n=1 Tax=Alkalispirochaeta americana TaxID=159291 RepID=A0A1N6SJF9_9SPIO|nr:TonB-dependent receptor [Alkalispirochaeta americana]SIQ41210.1 iron complex outermembrane recepter protein [Alkalispirochaeta americana]
MKRYLVGLVLLAAPGVLLYAQNQEKDREEKQKPATLEVVVTADRILTEIVSTAANVTVVTEEEIRSSGATNLPELLDRQAGVSFRSYSNAPQATVDMRGFGEGSGMRVLVLVDGRRQNNPDMSGINWLGIPLDSIERVEILRGGASALYGNHALGGVINIITRTPSPEVPLELTGSLALGSNMENQERLNLSLARERSRLRASVEHFSTDGHRDRSAYRALNFSMGALFDLSDTLEVGLSGRYSNIFYEMPGGLTRAQYKDDPSDATNTDDEANEHHFGLDLDLVWYPTPLARAEIALGYAAKLVETDMESFWPPNEYTDRDLHTFTASPALILDWDLGAVPLRTRLGLDWSWARQEITAWETSSRNTKNYRADLSQWTLGTVASTTAYVTEQLDLGGTLRYDRSTIGAEKDDEGIDSDTTHQALVFALNAVYRPLEYAKVFVSGGTLFRYPALDEQASVQGFGDQFMSNLDPEQGFTLEAGGGLYLGALLRLNASLYWMEMEDEIAWFTIDPVTWEGENRNLDKTRRLGGDLQIQSEPLEQLRISAGYSYIMATFAGGDNKDKEVPLVPNHSLDAQLAVRLLPELGLEFGPALTFRSRSYQGGDDANSEDRVDEYLLTDVFLRLRPRGLPGDLAVSAEVKNIFDETYAPFVNWDAYYPAPGRTFRLAASYRY